MKYVTESIGALMDEFAAGNVDVAAVIARLQSEALFLEVVSASQRGAAKIFDTLDPDQQKSFARIIAGA